MLPFATKTTTYAPSAILEPSDTLHTSFLSSFYTSASLRHALPTLPVYTPRRAFLLQGCYTVPSFTRIQVSIRIATSCYGLALSGEWVFDFTIVLSTSLVFLVIQRLHSLEQCKQSSRSPLHLHCTSSRGSRILYSGLRMLLLETFIAPIASGFSIHER